MAKRMISSLSDNIDTGFYVIVLVAIKGIVIKSGIIRYIH